MHRKGQKVKAWAEGAVHKTEKLEKRAGMRLFGEQPGQQVRAAIGGQRSGYAQDMADLLVSLDLWGHPAYSSDPPVPVSQPSAALLLLLLTHALGHLPALSHLLTSSMLFSSFVPTSPHCVTAALLPGDHSQSPLPRHYVFFLPAGL